MSILVKINLHCLMPGPENRTKEPWLFFKVHDRSSVAFLWHVFSFYFFPDLPCSAWLWFGLSSPLQDEGWMGFLCTIRGRCSEWWNPGTERGRRDWEHITVKQRCPANNCEFWTLAKLWGLNPLNLIHLHQNILPQNRLVT